MRSTFILLSVLIKRRFFFRDVKRELNMNSICRGNQVMIGQEIVTISLL